MRHPVPGRFLNRRGISNVIAAVILTAITITAGALLWTLHFNLPSSPPQVSYVIRAGLSYPVYGDPTDCVPWQPTTIGAPGWSTNWTAECQRTETGRYSLMNATSITFTQHTPTNIPLNLVNFTFICNNTILVGGSLAAMSWIPGSQTQPAPNAPTLGRCGSFDPHSGSFSTLYNRLGIYIPIDPNATVVTDGDTFVLYIHTPGSVFDPGGSGGRGGQGGPDTDDYHGAPPWCFTVPGACTIYLNYVGVPGTSLAVIPVYSLA